MGDRFLTNGFLKTNWDGHGSAFNTEDYIDLVRLARGENDHYLPDRESCRPGGRGILTRFENVVFGLSGEGVICWIKPKAEQQFLQQQFKDRYDNIYLQLYMLSLHQMYALVDMTKRLDEATPPIELIKKFKKIEDTGSVESLEKTSEELSCLRAEVAKFYLRDFFQQPALLTNHQEFYRHLQKVLGISDLLHEVQQSTSELEYLIGSLHGKWLDGVNKQKRISQNEQNNKLLTEISLLIKEQERAAKNELVLTLVVEGMAIPYYSYSFFAHALHFSDGFSAAVGIGIAIVTMGYTIFKHSR
jgi:hypothetical protein